MKPIQAVFKELDHPRKIVITTHPNPDADALGSSLGLYHWLTGRGHEVQVITPTDYPDFLDWMPGQETVICFDENTSSTVEAIINDAELLFCLDFSSTHRLKQMEAMVLNSPSIKVLIDHHLDPDDFADYQLWDTKAAATAELIFDLILMMNSQEEITADIANCLYAGIMTDTGSFKHPSTTSKVHKIVASLIEYGCDVSRVSRAIYDTNTVSRLRFLGYVLLEKLTVREDLGIAYIVVSDEESNRFQLKSGDTEGIVNFALSIQGIIMATIIIEKGDEVKLSFRSVGDYVVNTFAGDHFSGGGHKYASGGASELSLKETIIKYENLIETYKEHYCSPST